jgi:ATP-binding cassette subfamily F protein uup
LRATLADDALYARDPSAFNSAATKLSSLEAEHAASEERWLELEILREELER